MIKRGISTFPKMRWSVNAMANWSSKILKAKTEMFYLVTQQRIDCKPANLFKIRKLSRLKIWKSEIITGIFFQTERHCYFCAIIARNWKLSVCALKFRLSGRHISLAFANPERTSQPRFFFVSAKQRKTESTLKICHAIRHKKRYRITG